MIPIKGRPSCREDSHDLGTYLTEDPLVLSYKQFLSGARMLSKSKEIDALVVGSGPKGLAVAAEFRDAGLRYEIVDGAGPGNSWSPSRMLQNIRLHPLGWEVTAYPALSFESWWRSDCPLSIQDMEGSGSGFRTSGQYAHYLKWLGKQLQTETSTVLSIEHMPGKPWCISKSGAAPVIRAHCVVLATGLIGRGGFEFAHDPTGLRGATPLVQHCPADLRTTDDFVRFLGDSTEVGIIGASAGAAGAILELQAVTTLSRIHLVSSAPFSIFDQGNPWFRDPNGTPVAKVVREEFLACASDGRIVSHPDRAVLGGRIEGDRVILSTSQGDLSLPKVILCTGFQYNFRGIPSMEPLISSHVLSLSVNSPRHPRVGMDGQIHAGAASPEATRIYAVGEAATADLGMNHRWLFTTNDAVKAIRSSVEHLLGSRSSSGDSATRTATDPIDVRSANGGGI